MNDGDSFNSSVGKVTADQEEKAELTVYLAGGEEAEFYSVPVGTKYRIKELASTSIASYTIVDSNGLDKIENTSSTNTRPKEALSTELETVNEGEDVTVTFVNDTVSVDPEEAKDKVEVSVGVTKIVVNENEEVLEDNEDTFTFELRANDDSYPMPSSTKATVTGNGTVSFGTITFTETGTYVYEIKEKAEDSDKYTYDDAIYTLVFEVTKPEGLLEVTRTIMRNGFMGSTITFTNILNPEPDDEPSEDDKDDDKDEEKEEHNENNNNNDSSNNNTSDEEKESNKDNGVKTGDVVVIYLVNMAVASIVLVVSIKDKRKRR